ncbi:MAG: tetratricopeptide repeat protein [Acidobacteria bacterium]|nr:tetratricopeptide repeat protein [Acidobacteriota bacterium]
MFRLKLCGPLRAALLLVAIVGQAAAQGSAMPDADALFAAQKWAEAARAYEALIRTDPANGRLWYRLGSSLLSLGEYAKAVPAFHKAVEIGQRPEPMYGLAASYARLNDKEQAFVWLNKALAAHLSQPEMIERDANFVSLRDDPRFKEVLAAVARLTNPCASQMEYQQFDFWVGEWVVTSEGQTVATSSIQRIVKSCIIFENYQQADGYLGKSFNFYDAHLHRWRQTWVDVRGFVSEFSGEFKDGAMRFEGESHLADGSKVLRHMTLFKLSPDRVRQLSEVSTDDGKTWRVNYDFIYTRKS